MTVLMQLPRGALSLLVVQLLGQTVLHECERSLFVPFLRTLVVPLHPCERKGELDQHLARNQKPALDLQQQQQLPRSDLHAQKSGGVPEQIMLDTKPTPAAASSSSFVVEGREPERDGEAGTRADETSSALGENEQGVEGSKLSTTPVESALAGRPPVPTAYAFIELDRTEDQHTAGAKRAADDVGVGPALPPPLANYAEAHAHGGLNSIEAPPGPVLAGKDEEDGEAADSREFEAANNEKHGNAPGPSTLRTSSRDRQGTRSGGEGKPGASGEGGSMLDVSSMMNLKHSLSPAERAKIHPATLEETAATTNPAKGSGDAGELLALCPKSANDIIEEAQKRGGSLDCLRILSHAIALPVLGALGDTRGRKKITRVATIGLMIYFSLLVIVAFSSSRGGVAEDPLLRAPQHASLDDTSHLHGLQHQQPFFSSTAAATSSTATGLLPESSLFAILFSSTNCSRVVLPLAVFLHGCFAYLCLGFAIHNILMDLSAHSVNLQIFLTTLFDICAVCCVTIARFAVAAFLARATPRPDHVDHGPGAEGAAAAGAPPGGGLLPARPVQGDSAPFGWVFVFCLVLSSLVYIWQEHFLPETSPTMVRRIGGDEDHGGEAGPILPGKKSLFSGEAGAAGGAAGAGFHQDLRAPTSPPQYSAKPKDDREYPCGGAEDAAAHHRGGGSASVSSGSCAEDDDEEMRSLGAKNIFNLGDSFFDDEDEYDPLAATAASSTRLPHAMTLSPPSSTTTSASSTTPALGKYDEDDVVARRFVLDGNGGSGTPPSSARRRSTKNRSAARCLGRQGKAVHFVSKFLPEKWGWLMVGTSTTPRKSSSSKGISLSPDMITRPSKPTFETSFAPPRKASPFYWSFLKGPPGRGDFVRLHDYCASMSASFLDLFRNTLRINLHLLRTSIFLRYWCVQITFYYLSESISEVIASYSIAVWKWEPGDLERMWSKLGWVNAASVCILPMFMKYYFSNAAAGAGGTAAPGGGAGGQGGPANTVGQPPPRNFLPGNAAAGTYQTLSNKERGEAEPEFDYLESSSTPEQPTQTQFQPAGNINRQSVDVSQAGAEPNVYRRLSALLIFAVVATTASNFLFTFPPGHALKNDHGYFYVVGSTIRCAFGWQSSLRFAFLTARVPVKWRASAIALIATLKNTAAAIGAWYFSNVVFDAHVLDENGWDVSRSPEERLQHSADGNYTPKMWDAREVFRTSLMFMAVSDVFYIYALHRWR